MADCTYCGDSGLIPFTPTRQFLNIRAPNTWVICAECEKGKRLARWLMHTADALAIEPSKDGGGHAPT